MQLSEINRAIMFGQWTDAELTTVVEAVKFARGNLNRAVKWRLKVGDNVEFTSRKHGRPVRGFVEKIAVKYVTVNTGSGRWRVPANMLTMVPVESQ